jgi:hypothetical protein
MALNIDNVIASLQKLYAMRANLDKQIISAEKTLALAVGEVDKLKKTATAKAASVKKAVSGLAGLKK